MRSLIVDDHLEKSELAAKNTLYFYCDYADLPTLQPVHMYRALLQQLFFRGLMTESDIKSVVEAYKANTHGLGEQQLTILLKAAIQSCAGLQIVMDGLDECERGVQQAVTDTLCEFLAIGSPLTKVLVTSRDEGYLQTKLDKFDRLPISSEASAADIQSYITCSVGSRLSSGDLTIRSPALKEQIISKLIAKAQGMCVERDDICLFWFCLLMQLGFCGYISKLSTCAMQHPMTTYVKFSNIYRKD